MIFTFFLFSISFTKLQLNSGEKVATTGYSTYYAAPFQPLTVSTNYISNLQQFRSEKNLTN